MYLLQKKLLYLLDDTPISGNICYTKNCMPIQREVNMDYSERLNEIIKKKKITQTELAAKMKAKQQTVSSWINKRYPI